MILKDPFLPGYLNKLATRLKILMVIITQISARTMRF